jgi:hypothetical protein
MNEQLNPEISTELQKFYLQNKQWLSDVLFLEDETRFFQKIFDRVFSENVMGDHLPEIQILSAGLYRLEERRNHLKDQIFNQQHLLESMLEDHRITTGLDLVDENTRIIDEIKNLFISDRLIKNELFAMVEQLIRKEKAGHLLECV